MVTSSTAGTSAVSVWDSTSKQSASIKMTSALFALTMWLIGADLRFVDQNVLQTQLKHQRVPLILL